MFRRAPHCTRTPETQALSRLALTAGLFTIAALAVALPSNEAQAQSCQASGSLPMFFTPATGIVTGTLAQIPISIRNTSSTNPPGTSVDAVLKDEIVVKLACVDVSCSQVSAEAFDFIRCLDFDPAQVESCTPQTNPVTGGLEVVVTMTDAGVPLPADALMPVVTIETLAVVPLPFDFPGGVFSTRAQTSSGAIVTVDEVNCDPQVTGEAGGSVTAAFPPRPFVTIEKTCETCDQTVPPSPPPFTSEVTITVVNSGIDSAQNCRVMDIYDPGGPDEQILLDDNILELPVNTPVEFMVTTPAHPGQNVDNLATVVCEGTNDLGEDPPIQISDESTDVCECPDLSPDIRIDKICEDCSIPDGLTSDYTLTIENLGTAAAVNCQVTDTFDGQEIFGMSIARVDPGDPPIVIDETTPRHETTKVNTATIVCDEFISGVAVEDIAIADCVCEVAPDISVVKECGICDPITYVSPVEVTVSNTGDFEATQCQVTDLTLGVGLNTTIPVLAAMDSQTFPNLMTSPLAGSGTNTVDVVCDDFPEGVTNTAMFSTSCECPFTPEVTLEKTCGQCNPLTRVSPVTVTVANTGTGGARGCQVTDVINGVTELDQTIDLGPGDDMVFNFDVGPLPNENTLNTAQVQCEDFPVGGGGIRFAEDTDNCFCPIIFPIIAIQKECEDCNPDSQPDPYQSAVTITITNTGNGDATNCMVKDTFGGTVIFQDDIGTVPMMSMQTIEIDTPGYSSTTLNTVEIVCDDNPEIGAITQADDTTSCVCELPDVSIEKECDACDPDANPPNTSDVRVTVRNDGEGAANNCVVTDTFQTNPPMVLFVEDLGTLDPGEVAPVITAVTPPHLQNVLNEVEVICDFLPAPARTMDEAADLCEGCQPPPFVPPCSGVECEICFPDDLKSERGN